jgi:hypothetical protein
VCHESGFLGECVGRCHPGFGRCCRAVELQDSLRRVKPAGNKSKQDLARNEAFDRDPSAAAEACGLLQRRHIDTDQSRLPRIPRPAQLSRKPLQKRVRSRRQRARLLKAVDGESGADQKSPQHHQQSKRVRSSVLRIHAPGRCKAFWFKHAFELLFDDRGARHSGRTGGLRALSARQSDIMRGGA